VPEAPDRLPSIRVLDALPEEAFRRALGPLFEDAPRFLARLAAERPFNAWGRVFAAAEWIAISSPEPEQIELLDAHPRIGAAPGTVSALSFLEQGYDRDAAEAAARDARTEAERVAAELARLNDAYEARFGFRYVVFVAGRPRAAIVPLMERALGADRAAERDRGLRDVVHIARARATRIGIEGEAAG
jgi:2-oxo-4-hydroxy-4-carboxy--5-ureidoimidazoline (OHCU) decarboxylase